MWTLTRIRRRIVSTPRRSLRSTGRSPLPFQTVAECSWLNRHLSNDGVEISPPPHHLSNGASGAEKPPDPHQLFTDLEGCNVGFKHFHPMPVSQQGNQLSGQGNMGGVWEWTCSALEKHEGFEPMKLYPAYTGLVSPVLKIAKIFCLMTVR